MAGQSRREEQARRCKLPPASPCCSPGCRSCCRAALCAPALLAACGNQCTTFLQGWSSTRAGLCGSLADTCPGCACNTNNVNTSRMLLSGSARPRELLVCPPLVPWQRLRIASVTGLGSSLAARSAAAAAGRLPPLSGLPSLSAAGPAAGAAASGLLPPVMYPCTACKRGPNASCAVGHGRRVARQKSRSSSLWTASWQHLAAAVTQVPQDVSPRIHMLNGRQTTGGGSPGQTLRRAPQMRRRCDCVAV